MKAKIELQAKTIIERIKSNDPTLLGVALRDLKSNPSPDPYEPNSFIFPYTDEVLIKLARSIKKIAL